MGTRTRGEIVITHPIMKPLPKPDGDAKGGHNYETVPRLPTVKITQKTKQGPNLSDFVDNAKLEEHKRNRFELKPVGREKAFAILKQYNNLVSSDVTLTVKNLPPLKVPLKKPHITQTLPKPETTPRKVPIFTEGISSISKSNKPSFVVPKDKVIRANLPNNIIVAKNKDSFAMGVKPPARKSPGREGEEGTKFKQMHNLGLDSLPIVNLEKYMSAKSKPQHGIRGVKPLVSANKNKPHRLEPLHSDSNLKTTAEISRSYDWSINRRRGHRWKDQNSAHSEGKAKVVWVGKNIASEYSLNKNRLLNNIHQQYDNRQRDDYLRGKNIARDPAVCGVCSLAPFDIIGQSKLIVGDIRNPDSYRVYQGHQTRSNINDYFFESDSDSSLNTDWKNMINNAITHRSSSISSGTVTPKGVVVPNPPPSYVSSSANDEEELIPLEISKTMHRIQEERSSLMMDSASNRAPQASSASRDLHMGLSPAPVIIVNEVPVEEESGTETVEPKQTPRWSKEPLVSNVIEIKMEYKHLNVPKFAETERRPPVKSDEGESNSISQVQSSASDSKPKNIARPAESQKLNVTTLQLDGLDDRKTPPVTFESNINDAEKKGLAIRNAEKVESENDTLKHLTVNSKTLQFISPLQTQSNAKRQ